MGVTELVALIKEKLYAHQHQAHKEERRHKQRVGGLPSASDRVKLPAYWTVSFHCHILFLYVLPQFPSPS